MVGSEAVETVLAAELAARRRDVQAVDPSLLPDVDRVIRFTLSGGKRIRPQFLWWGWRAAGGEPSGPRAAEAWRAAGSLELIQTSALVHDDIIDNSATRRGQPSVHAAVGVSVAILLGDLALIWADDMFHRAGRALRAGDEAFSAWAGMRTEVIAGQLLDLAAASHIDDDPAAQAERAQQVNRFKTAAYTVERPLHLGAALAGGPAELTTALRRFGVDVGLAFQLRDDLLGVFGDAAITGKPAGDDLIEGKQTLLLATARQSLSPDRRVELDAGIGVTDDPVEVRRLADIIASSGAPAQMESQITRLVESGAAALSEVAIDAEVRAALTALASSATRRTS